MHARLMKAHNFGLAGGTAFSSKVLGASKQRIRQGIQKAQQHLEASPATALDAARELASLLASYAQLFVVADLAADSGANDILDEGANVCMNCAVRANKLTNDDVGFVDVLAKVLEVSRSEATRERASKNLEAGRNAVLSEKLGKLCTARSASRI
jgi:hypothetical protein